MTSKRFPLDFDPLAPSRAMVLLGDAETGTDGGKVSIGALINLIEAEDIAALGFARVIDLPTHVSQLINDLGFQTASQVTAVITAQAASNWTHGTLSFGNGLAYNAQSGVLSADTGNAYTLPLASTIQIGGVRVDGSTITMNPLTGQISAFNSIRLAQSGTPLPDGIGTLGDSAFAAHANHQHPTDSTRAPKDSPVFATKVTVPIWLAAPDHSQGLIGFNSNAGRFEFGDGTATHQFVRRDGDTMTGPLTLPGAPTANQHAATKQYVDNAVASIPGGGGGGGSGTVYTFNQNTPATVWVITHNSNSFPSVTVVDSSGREVEGDVQYLSNTQVSLNFASPFSGTAYLN